MLQWLTVYSVNWSICGHFIATLECYGMVWYVMVYHSFRMRWDKNKVFTQKVLKEICEQTYILPQFKGSNGCVWGVSGTHDRWSPQTNITYTLKIWHTR